MAGEGGQPIADLLEWLPVVVSLGLFYSVLLRPLAVPLPGSRSDGAREAEVRLRQGAAVTGAIGPHPLRRWITSGARRKESPEDDADCLSSLIRISTRFIQGGYRNEKHVTAACGFAAASAPGGLRHLQRTD
ncbi:hypothetical protein GCM10027018_28710 [Paenibacillus thermoaerophilus]